MFATHYGGPSAPQPPTYACPHLCRRLRLAPLTVELGPVLCWLQALTPQCSWLRETGFLGGRAEAWLSFWAISLAQEVSWGAQAGGA